MKKYLFLLGVVVSLGVLFSKNVEASETKVATIDNETVVLEKVEDLETISSILEEYGYSKEEVGAVYKYTIEDPANVVGQQLYIKLITECKVRIESVNSLIDGEDHIELTRKYQAVTLYSTGSEWLIL